jgi:hypothetical protein
MPPDWIALIASFAYVFAAIGIAGGLRKWRGYSVEFTRKFIHIAWAPGRLARCSSFGTAPGPLGASEGYYALW